MTSISQLNRRNEKKRTRDFRKRVDEFLITGRKIILKNPPNQDMVNYAASKGLNAYDMCAKTISPEEQEKRRQEHNVYQREQNKKVALATNGVYKGTGEQEKKLSKQEQEKEDYFKLPPEEQIAAHKAKQLIRDITRGWNCPVCKGIMPEVIDLPEEEQVDYHTVNYNDKCTFIFHIDCYANYLLGRHRSVHRVNSREKMIKDYLAWGHEKDTEEDKEEEEDS